MPFKSLAQMKKIASMEKAGLVKKGTTKAWAAETPNIAKLPEHIKQSKRKGTLNKKR
ncbi:hypothetical protein KKC67_03370 [Patescibacteria group bacterium]|nr:hypothetical protein [Patescibacteria group bacterium]MBU0879861.1 hypothetical protein [Patescibacteria group bacterium]MBU1992019.1 hypothetical protein [Patescibacteria group bacterium]MBU2474296.1 hypothetical protein [Candidatus Omnitrophota bacterium]